jgi:rhodanese-related sulfurtransferase
MYVSRITPREVTKLLDRGLHVEFVDARPPEALKSPGRQIPGAVRVVPSSAMQQAAALRRSAEVVVYCNSPEQVASFEASVALLELGFQKIHVLEGGLAAWEQARYPLEDRQ